MLVWPSPASSLVWPPPASSPMTRRCIQEIKLATAKVALGELLKMDWTARHEVMKRFKTWHPDLHRIICSLLSPDEHIEGEATGVNVDTNSIIILKGRPRTRQVTLHRFFKRSKLVNEGEKIVGCSMGMGKGKTKNSKGKGKGKAKGKGKGKGKAKNSK